MKMKIVPLEKFKTKKGQNMYNSLCSLGGARSVIKVLSDKEYPLDKEVEIEVRVPAFWLEAR